MDWSIDASFDAIADILSKLICGPKPKAIAALKEQYVAAHQRQLAVIGPTGRAEFPFKYPGAPKDTPRSKLANAIAGKGDPHIRKLLNNVYAHCQRVNRPLLDDLLAHLSSDAARPAWSSGKVTPALADLTKLLPANDKFIPAATVAIESFANHELAVKLIGGLTFSSAKSFDGKLVVTVNPLDILLCSEHTQSLTKNQKKWASCHRLDGERSTGPLQHMVSGGLAMIYLYEKEEAYAPAWLENQTFKDLVMPLKRWRRLCHCSADGETIFWARQYPHYLADLPADQACAIAHLSLLGKEATVWRRNWLYSEAIHRRGLAYLDVEYCDTISYSGEPGHERTTFLVSGNPPCAFCGDHDLTGHQDFACQVCRKLMRCIFCSSMEASKHLYDGRGVCDKCAPRCQKCSLCDSLCLDAARIGLTGVRLACQQCVVSKMTKYCACGHREVDLVNGRVADWECSACRSTDCSKCGRKAPMRDMRAGRNANYCFECSELMASCAHCGYIMSPDEVSGSICRTCRTSLFQTRRSFARKASGTASATTCSWTFDGGQDFNEHYVLRQNFNGEIEIVDEQIEEEPAAPIQPQPEDPVQEGVEE